MPDLAGTDLDPGTDGLRPTLGPGAARALHTRAGTVFRLLTSGTIRVGDEVDLAP